MKTHHWKSAVAAAGLAVVTATSSIGADFSQFKARMLGLFAEQEPRLALTAQQKPKFDLMIKESMERRTIILEKHGVTPGSKITQAAMQSALPELEAENAQLHGSLVTVLSPDQLKTFGDISQAMRKALLSELSGSP